MPGPHQPAERERRGGHAERDRAAHRQLDAHGGEAEEVVDAGGEGEQHAVTCDQGAVALDEAGEPEPERRHDEQREADRRHAGESEHRGAHEHAEREAD
jgi:hypothetical protein